MTRPRVCLCGLLCVLCLGCGSTTEVVIECPSPNGATAAVLFLRMGGGAIGWMEEVLALQPANLPPTLPRSFGVGPSVEVLNIDQTRGITLDWKDEGHLAVELGVPPLTTVTHMFHQYPVMGDRQVVVMFSEVEAFQAGRHHYDERCRTGGREIVNPPLKRLSN